MAVQACIDIGEEQRVPGFLEIRGGANLARNVPFLNVLCDGQRVKL